MNLLPDTHVALWAITDNPKLPLHHQDPFDRILVAQALVEPMRLMIHDPLVALYNDNIRMYKQQCNLVLLRWCAWWRFLYFQLLPAKMPMP